MIKKNAFAVYGYGHTYNPQLLRVAPSAASSEEAITLRGVNLGHWIQASWVGGGQDVG